MPLDVRGGVYGIFNVINDRVYIGMTYNFKPRWHDHKAALRRGNHTNKSLQADWKQYGPDAFEFRALEICEDNTVEGWNAWRSSTREPEWEAKFGDRVYEGLAHSAMLRGGARPNTGPKPNHDTRMVTVAFVISEDDDKWISEEALRRGINKSAVVRWVIDHDRRFHR